MAVNSRREEYVADETPPGLPGSIAAAWGLRDRPGKGPKRGLTLDQIVQAAISVAASEGLAAVSMGHVAAVLGVGTMSLYRYVESKRELLELMMDTALGPPPAADPDVTWRAGLSHWAWSALAAYRRQLWVVQIPLAGPPVTPNSLGWLELALQYMRDTALNEGQKMSVILLISNYVRNSATVEAQIDAAVRASGRTNSDLMAGYNQVLTTVLDSRFPELLKVAASGVMSTADDWDDEFTFGLERILDGVDVLLRRLGDED
jgi:AcrR family transcriptional regulator